MTAACASHLSDSSDLRRAFAAVRRTPAYRAVAKSWSEPVILACSGGADSMGLLVVAAVARAAGRVGPVIVANVDHRTRPETADEARLVAEQARRFSLPFVAVRVEGMADEMEGGPEAALRELRYERLARLSRSLGIHTVVTAHTRDDQVETVLLRLLTGASPLGAAGMEHESTFDTRHGTIRLLRPLLGVGRADLVTVLELTQTPHAEDPSNLDPRYRRNRIRHELLPLLRDIEPGADQALLRSVELARQDAEIVEALAQERYRAVVRRDGEGAWVDRGFLRSEPAAVSGRVLKMVATGLIGGDAREITHERISAVIAAARGRTGAVIELPYGLRAIIERDHVRIEDLRGEETGERVATDDHEILIDAETIQRRVSELGAEISEFYGDDPPLLVGVLNGAVIFMADLARALCIPVTFEFMAVSSYGSGRTSSGTVRILKDLDSDIAGRRVLIVEDIVDSGTTLDYLRRIFEERNPREVRVVTLLRKPGALKAQTQADWVGFDVDDVFIVVYGLDYTGRYRNLPYIAALLAD